MNFSDPGVFIPVIILSIAVVLVVLIVVAFFSLSKKNKRTGGNGGGDGMSGVSKNTSLRVFNEIKKTKENQPMWKIEKEGGYGLAVYGLRDFIKPEAITFEKTETKVITFVLKDGGSESFAPGTLIKLSYGENEIAQRIKTKVDNGEKITLDGRAGLIESAHEENGIIYKISFNKKSIGNAKQAWVKTQLGILFKASISIK